MFIQIHLFVSIGLLVDITYLNKYWVIALAILLLGTLFRFIAVWISLIKTPLNLKERLFCGIAYLPIATVQAAMGSVPLMIKMPSSKLILIISVLAILIFTLIGSFPIKFTYKNA